MLQKILGELPETWGVNIVLHERHYNYFHHMPDFSLKMHQIQFSTDFVTGFPNLDLGEREGKAAKEGEGKGSKGGRGKGKGKWRGKG